MGQYEHLRAFLNGAVERELSRDGRVYSIRRGHQGSIEVAFRRTPFLEFWPDDETVKIQARGWYTPHTKNALNLFLVDSPRIEEFTPLGAMPQHRYLGIRSSDGMFVPFYEREGVEHLYRVRGDRSMRISPPAMLDYSPEVSGSVVQYNVSRDLQINAYLGAAHMMVDWNDMADMLERTRTQPFMMRPVDIQYMLDAERLDAPVALSALRYDHQVDWYVCGRSMTATCNLTELRNTLRVFLRWALYHGPVMMQRGARARPLTLRDELTF